MQNELLSTIRETKQEAQQAKVYYIPKIRLFVILYLLDTPLQSEKEELEEQYDLTRRKLESAERALDDAEVGKSDYHKQSNFESILRSLLGCVRGPSLLFVADSDLEDKLNSTRRELQEYKRHYQELETKLDDLREEYNSVSALVSRNHIGGNDLLPHVPDQRLYGALQTENKRVANAKVQCRCHACEPRISKQCLT